MALLFTRAESTGTLKNTTTLITKLSNKSTVNSPSRLLQVTIPIFFLPPHNLNQPCFCRTCNTWTLTLVLLLISSNLMIYSIFQCWFMMLILQQVSRIYSLQQCSPSLRAQNGTPGNYPPTSATWPWLTFWVVSFALPPAHYQTRRGGAQELSKEEISVHSCRGFFIFSVNQTKFPC